MRWIVLALLLANIGLFAWFGTLGRPEVSVAPAAGKVGPSTDKDIALVSEVSRENLEKMAPTPRSKHETDVSPGGGELCTMLGPFEEEYQGEDIVQRLQALQVEGALREIEMEGQMRYWVYLEPLGSRREAFRKLRELQAAGVDSYVIPKGSLTNGISFGIFSEPERAESLAGELRGRGFAAQTREEPQTYFERWVVLPPGEGEDLAEDFWSGLQLEYPDLDRRQNLCRELQPE